MNRFLSLLVVVALSGLAGCIAGDDAGSAGLSPGSTDPASTVIVEPTPGIQVAANRGAIVGVVLNDAGFGLKDAHVFIFQTEFSKVTGSDGRFSFLNVTPGSHVVRVEAKGFAFRENTTTVTAGNVTTLEFVMIPESDTGAGYVQHLHDFWVGRDRVEILNQQYDFTQPAKTSGIAGPVTYQPSAMALWGQQNTTNGDMRIRFPDDGEPRMIFPGTKEIQVTVSWGTSASTMNKVALKVTPHGGSTFHAGRQANGYTWKIPTGQANWDGGHQKYTLWAFYINPYQDPVNDGADYRPGLLYGPVHVKIVVIKGELLPEGPHEKFWEKGDQVLLRDHGDNLWVDCNSAYRVVERSRQHCEAGLTGQPVRIVPPGTGKLSVEMKWQYSLVTEAPPSDLTVLYRSGNQDRWNTALANFHIASCQNTAAQTRLCEIPVKAGETDGYYQKTSIWGFTYGVRGAEKEDLDREPRNLKISFRVVAIKDPNYAGGGNA